MQEMNPTKFLGVHIDNHLNLNSHSVFILPKFKEDPFCIWITNNC